MSTLSVDRAALRHYGDTAGRYWSVSQVIEVVLGPHRYADDNAIQRGTDIHEIFSLTIGHRMGWCEEPEVMDEYAGYRAAILSWVEQANPQPMMLERMLRHKTLPYAGTVDYVGMLGEAYGVLDLKTGQPDKSHILQVHAYKQLIDKGSKMWVLYIKADGSFKQTEVKNSPREWAAFQNGLSILQYREG